MIRSWLRHHRRAFGLSLAKLVAHKSTMLLNSLVIGVALALPAGGYALLASLERLTARLAPEPQISLYLKGGAARTQIDAISAALRSDARVGAWRFVSRGEALETLRSTEGLAEVVAALGENPLPDAFVVRARQTAPEALEALARDLQQLQGVDQVQRDSAWVRRLAAITATGRIATALLALVLAIGLVAVTFNSIRLQILTHAEEIEVSRLIGASDGYIARPFYYLGLVQGALGGLVALGILAGALAALNVGVRDLAAAYGSAFQLGFPGPADAAGLLGFAALLGWLGAYLSVSVHLHQIP